MSRQARKEMNGFRETEIGLLPEDWDIVKAGDIFSPINFRLKHLDKDKDHVPVLSMTRHNGLILQNKKFEKEVASKDKSNYKIVKRGQLVYGFPIDEGVIAVLHRYPIGAVSPAYNVWDITRDVDLFYLDILLKHPLLIKQYIKLSSNVVHRRRNLSPKDFVNVIVPLPPIFEQRKISYVLSTIQRAIKQQDKIISATQELKKSLMRHLFTYGPVPIDEVERVSLNETEIGPVPEHWNIVKLNDFCYKPQYGYTASAIQKPIGPKLLRITDIQDSGINWLTVPHCICSSKDLEKYKLKSGDIVIARIGATTGKSYLINECPQAVFASYLIRIRVKPQIISRFLYYFFNTTLYWNQINVNKESNLKKGISASVLSNLVLPLPTYSEQQQITLILSTMDKKIEVEEKRKASLQSLFQTMLHLLMTGKVRVKDLEVNVRGAGI